MQVKVLKRLIQNRYLSYWAVLFLDIILTCLSAVFSILAVRYFGGGKGLTKEYALVMFAVVSCINIACFVIFRTYRHIIRHSSLKGLLSLGLSMLLKSLIIFLLLRFIPGVPLGRKSTLLMVGLDLLISLTMLIGVRVLMIVAYDWIVAHSGDKRSRLLIYGVGDKSVSLTTRLYKSNSYRIVGFVSYGKKMGGYKLSEYRNYYFRNSEEIEKVIEMSSADAVLFASDDDVYAEKDRLIRYCSEHRAKPLKILVAPHVDEVDGKGLHKGKMRSIRIEDLLGRDEIEINHKEIRDYFDGKVVMVTGGAGSIGSEICRQMANLGVSQLIVFDMAESPLHDIRLELERSYPHLKLVPFIGDVRSSGRLRVAFERFHPDVVFHAAAYKHVPLMEENPCEAVVSNVLGTMNVAELCVRYEVDKVVVISTDKAVNPTNVMGCTKRLAEIYCQSKGLAIAEHKVEGKTKFVTTRFGNVLGSNGSVIPHFRRQIEEGGPVTVTHPEINRFFMTIPEACRLVMEAAVMGEGNEIFVFEMGKPVKIVDLAERMIKLAGYVPGKDIEIVFTGLRPGEKLYEEILSTEENTIPTHNKKINIAKVKKYEFAAIEDEYKTLIETAKKGDSMATVRLMKMMVPEYVSNNSEFECLDKELRSGEESRIA